jgi:hypothetical protein
MILLIGLAMASAAGSSIASTARSGMETAHRTSPCTRPQTHELALSFLAAFNQGNYEKLDSLFAEEPAFVEFATSGPGRRVGKTAQERGTLIDYFHARHAKQDKFRLLSYSANGNAPQWSNFSLEMRRSATGVRHGDWFDVIGKGAAVCEGDLPRLILVNLSGPDPERS